MIAHCQHRAVSEPTRNEIIRQVTWAASDSAACGLMKRNASCMPLAIVCLLRTMCKSKFDPKLVQNMAFSSDRTTVEIF